MNIAAQYSKHGHSAYASQQMHLWAELSKSSEKSLAPIASSSLKQFKSDLIYILL